MPKTMCTRPASPRQPTIGRPSTRPGHRSEAVAGLTARPGVGLRRSVEVTTDRAGSAVLPHAALQGADARERGAVEPLHVVLVEVPAEGAGVLPSLVTVLGAWDRHDP